MDFDLLVDGWRIDVKTGKMDACFEWTFNIHRHGVLKEDLIDFYILRLEGVPGTKGGWPVHLLLRSPVGRKTMRYTVRSLISGDAVQAVEFRKFAKGDYGIGPVEGQWRGRIVARESVENAG